jgi:hypothetical protein
MFSSSFIGGTDCHVKRKLNSTTLFDILWLNIHLSCENGSASLGIEVGTYIQPALLPYKGNTFPDFILYKANSFLNFFPSWERSTLKSMVHADCNVCLIVVSEYELFYYKLKINQVFV